MSKRIKNKPAERSAWPPALSSHISLGDSVKSARGEHLPDVHLQADEGEKVFAVRRSQGGDKNIKVATWNVRGVKRLGKLQTIVEQMEKQNIKIMGICELFVSGNSDYMITTLSGKEYMVHLRGEAVSRKEVGAIVTKNLEEKISNIENIDKEGHNDCTSVFSNI